MSSNASNKLKNTKADKRLMTFFLAIIISWITMAFIISPVKSDDLSGIIINVLLGPVVIALYSLLFLFLLGTILVFSYFLIAIITILITHWINPSLEIYLLDNKFLSFFKTLFVKNLNETILDFEKSGTVIMLLRIILFWVFHYIIYLIAPATVSVINYIQA
jgi:hypothetical protein